MRKRLGRTPVVLAIACVLIAGGVTGAALFPDASRAADGTATTSQTEANSGFDTRIKELEDERTWIIAPMAALIAVLTIGGALSVVFSLRDQRRVSQLHELAVSGEFSAQRRAEQSHASFLEESQKTLTLVNDTLRLAKEATDRANQAADVRSKAKLDGMEDRAARLMFSAFEAQDFDALLDNEAHYAELETLARELREFEASVRFEGFSIPPYCAFVRAIDQFLRNDTDEAQHTLRVLDQQQPTGDLHRFTLYWLGYISTTIGRYTEAINRFEDDEVGLSKGNLERLQLERIIKDTKFFKHARDWEERRPAGSRQPKSEPADRYLHVAPILGELAKLADEVNAADKAHRGRISHLVARTRTDIYAWIAYDATRLQKAFSREIVREARISQEGLTSRANERMTEDAALDAIADEGRLAAEGASRRTHAEAEVFASLAERPEVARAFAWVQAEAICAAEDDSDFGVDFAGAECAFALLGAEEEGDDQSVKEAEGRQKQVDAVVKRYQGLVVAIAARRRQHRELRRIAELDAAMVICHTRLVALLPPQARRTDAQEALSTLRHVHEATDAMHANVTVFSSLQRRNLDQGEFVGEAETLVKHAHIDIVESA